MKRSRKREPVRVGVGIDTARYGHHVAFLGEDRQEVAKDFTFLESAAGYRQLEEALDRITQRVGGRVHFDVRIDAAGQYAGNLEAHLRGLKPAMRISVGEPKRNRDYRNVHYPKRKADAVDSRACARYAVVERPEASAEVGEPMRALREVASALSAQRRQTTRHINQLHNLLARVFPELATLAADLSKQWVLALLSKYPSPKRIAAARDLSRIRYLRKSRANELQAAARTSVGSLKGDVAESLVERAVANVRCSQQAEAKLEVLLAQAYEESGEGGHQQLVTIPGIGKKTAAALSAKISSIDRFESAKALVGYFGIFPEENTSGVDRCGRPLAKGTMKMSAKGDDLVRALLWMASKSATRCNPAVRALYRRQRAAGKRGDVALGCCMNKMLHLVFAIWKTNRPFDPQYHRWEDPSEPSAQTTPQAPVATAESEVESTIPSHESATRSAHLALVAQATDEASMTSSEPVAADRCGAPATASSPAQLASCTSGPNTVAGSGPTNELATRSVCERPQAACPAKALALTTEQPVVMPRAPVTAFAAEKKAAGHKEAMPPETVVTAAANELARSVLAASTERDKPGSAAGAPDSKSTPWVVFAHLRAQITIEQVLWKLAVFQQLRGRGAQRRGPCPIHGGSDERHGDRPFSVNLDKNAFRCMSPACAKQGNALDLWAAARGLALRPAAIDLAQTFGLELAPSSSRSPRRR